MAVVGVYGLPVHEVLYPYGVALPIGAAPAGPAIGSRVHVERLPVGGVAVTEHVINAAVLRTPVVNPALRHGDAGVRKGKCQEVSADCRLLISDSRMCACLRTQ